MEKKQESIQEKDPCLEGMQEKMRSLESILQCPICTSLLSDPRMTLCGHHFCGECWSKYKKITKGDTCPICRQVCVYPAVKNRLLGEVLSIVFNTKKRKRKECGEKEIIRRIYHSLNKKTPFPFGYQKYFDHILESCGIEDITLCGCGLISLERVVRKENHNHGRPFLSCPLGKEGCGFFEWLDVTSS